MDSTDKMQDESKDDKIECFKRKSSTQKKGAYQRRKRSQNRKKYNSYNEATFKGKRNKIKIQNK